MSSDPHQTPPGEARGLRLAALAFGAIGVVYGDIGTSPLYAIKECVTLPHGVAPVTANIFGVLSLVFWSITLVVSVKYLFYVMRADNDGDGGVLAVMALTAQIAQDASVTARKRAIVPRPSGGPLEGDRLFVHLLPGSRSRLKKGSIHRWPASRNR